MKTFPLRSLSVEEAMTLQFKAVDAITRHFDGSEVLSLGDLGVSSGINKPRTTLKAEQVIAELFDAESALFVRGAGTGAIRWALVATVKPGDTILVHKAPVYPTTKVTLDTMDIRTLEADFNDTQDITRVLEQYGDTVSAALVQHTRQKIDDKYDFKEVIETIKDAAPALPIITDDNYAALKVPEIGCQAGADIATFSCFKTLGPQGVGVLIGKKKYIDTVYKLQYSGGSQIQGFEAMEVLRGLIYAPVSLAIQAEVGEELVARLNAGEVPSVKNAFLANAQSKVVLVEFQRDIAPALLAITPKYGAAAHPVGSESIYEFAPMIYRISGTFRAADPALERRMIRINPMRSGADTILRILTNALEEIETGGATDVSG